MTAAWQRELLTRGGVRIFQALAGTWRLRDVYEAPNGPYRLSATPCLYVAWHAQMLPLIAWHRDESLVIVVSEHGDGELVARAAAPWGYELIRGSSTRGGTRALLAMTRALEAGKSIAMTPDGPKGPAETFAPGALIAAQRVGVPLVFMTAAAQHEWRLSSWDRFSIPKPFTRIAVAHSAPYHVQAASSREAAEEAKVAQQHLMAISAFARRALQTKLPAKR